jgi:glyceraldehyde 3-phosphate dehydrogenase
MKKASQEEPLKGIVEYLKNPYLVSSDIISSKYSSNFDPSLTQVLDPHTISVSSWYDNEGGYSEGVVNFMKFIASKLQ